MTAPQTTSAAPPLPAPPAVAPAGEEVVLVSHRPGALLISPLSDLARLMVAAQTPLADLDQRMSEWRCQARRLHCAAQTRMLLICAVLTLAFVFSVGHAFASNLPQWVPAVPLLSLAMILQSERWSTTPEKAPPAPTVDDPPTIITARTAGSAALDQLARFAATRGHATGAHLAVIGDDARQLLGAVDACVHAHTLTRDTVPGAVSPDQRDQARRCRDALIVSLNAPPTLTVEQERVWRRATGTSLPPDPMADEPGHARACHHTYPHIGWPRS